MSKKLEATTVYETAATELKRLKALTATAQTNFDAASTALKSAQAAEQHAANELSSAERNLLAALRGE